MDESMSSVTFGNVGLGQLLPSHAEAWIKTMQEQELQPTTIRTRFVNVRGVIRAAVRERFLARDITENVRLPRTRKTSAAMSIPTAEEVGALLHASEGWFTAYLAVCFFGGLRRGEASALQIGDWDFLRKELHVQRQVQFTDDGRTEVRGPKYGSERTVSFRNG
jgi:integrase